MITDLSSFSDRLPFGAGKLSEAQFQELALELFSLQFRHNEPYQKLCNALGVPESRISQWSEIPAVPARAFKDLELSCLKREQRTKVFYSSGTTEQKASRHFHDSHSLTVYEKSLWTWFSEHLLPGLDLRQPRFELVILTPPAASAPSSSLVYMFEMIRRKVGAEDSGFVGSLTADGAWCVDFDRANAALDSNCEKPKLILGTAFSFVHLLDHLARKNVRLHLPAGSRAMETGGYKGRSRVLSKTELHDLIEQILGIPRSHIVCEYGMSELSSQAYDARVATPELEQDARRAFHFPPWARARIISPETGREVCEGETGLIRVFDLANVYSVMAIQTEDLGVCRGDGFELLGRAELAEQRGCSLMAV